MTVRKKSQTVTHSFAFASSSMTIIGLLMGASVAYAETISDLASDVQQGLGTAAQNAMVSAIKAQDYQSSWDEFGTNILADGEQTPADIQKRVLDDITRDLQVQLAYDQKDEQYLQLRQSSPEEIVAVEGDGGNDLLPENYIEPHPSLDANPEVNPTALDMSAPTVDLLKDASDITVIPDVATVPEDVPVLPDSLIPPEGEWKPADVTVFENILNMANPNTDAQSSKNPDTNSDAVPASGADVAPPPDAPVAPAEAPSDAPAN